MWQSELHVRMGGTEVSASPQRANLNFTTEHKYEQSVLHVGMGSAQVLASPQYTCYAAERTTFGNGQYMLASPQCTGVNFAAVRQCYAAKRDTCGNGQYTSVNW